MITCIEFDRQLVDYVANEVTPDQKRDCDDHAKNCPPCKAHLESYRIVVTITRCLPCHTLPENLREKLRALMMDAQSERADRE